MHCNPSPTLQSIRLKTGLPWHRPSRVRRLGFDYDFRWIEDYSIHALSDVIRQKERFEFIYTNLH
jgi:hypothetical protein